MVSYSLFTRNIHTFQGNVREPVSRGSQLFLCLDFQDLIRELFPEGGGGSFSFTPWILSRKNQFKDVRVALSQSSLAIYIRLSLFADHFENILSEPYARDIYCKSLRTNSEYLEQTWLSVYNSLLNSLFFINT